MRLTEMTGTYRGTPDPDITGITLDSRAVKAGMLFAALPGAKTDGVKFIADAVKAGAAAILAAKGTVLPPGTENVALVESENPRRRLSLMAAKFYGRQPGTIAAVTGTNGKTSTAVFTQQIWQALGHKAASIGTLGVRAPGREDYGSLTTPDPITLHAELAALARDGVTHLSLEASSHGLAQFRLDGVELQTAGFTNLTRDHLDYHATMEDYLAAKSRLFTDLLPADGIAVLNADVPEYTALRDLCKKRKLKVHSYGRAGVELKLIDRKPMPEGQKITLEITGKRHDLLLPLVGAFQVMNVLCAFGLALGKNLGDVASQKKALAFLPYLQGAPGRLQAVGGHPAGAAIYVDYAHTPDALDNALTAVRPHTRNRLICIVGCGGDRDPGKRPMMGKIASELADLVLVSDDNPRTEDPAKIRAAIMAAAPRAKEIAGRRAAIQWAVKELRTGDVLVIAGKGHERGQIVGTTVEPFDDVEEAQNAIAQWKGRS